MIEPRPETLARLEEKFARIAYERGNLSRVSYRLGRREHRGKLQPKRGRSGGGCKPTPGMVPLDPELQRRVLARYHRYLEDARRRGKDLSRQCQRQPYLMLAIRYETRSREEIVEQYQKARKTMHQKSYYYGVMSRRAKARMRGENG